MTRTRFIGGGGQSDPYGTMGNTHTSVTQYASQHAGADEEEHGLFSSVMSNLMDKDDHLDTNDEEMEHAKNSRQRIYQDGEENQNPRDIGAAAAAEAMEKHRSNGESGGMNALLGMAMGEAAKLFAKQGGSGGSGSSGKSEAIQQAAMMAMKMYASKQGGSGSGGSSSGGGLGSVMSLLAAAQGGSSGGGSSGGLGGMVSSVLGGGGKDSKHSSGGGDIASKLIGKLF